MNLSLDWILLCEYALIEGTGRPSLLNLLDLWPAGAIPTTMPIITAVLRFTGQPHATAAITVDWIGPDGGAWIPSASLDVAFSASGLSYFPLQWVGVPVTQAGMYMVRVSTPGGILGHANFRVVAEPDESGPSETTLH